MSGAQQRAGGLHARGRGVSQRAIFQRNPAFHGCKPSWTVGDCYGGCSISQAGPAGHQYGLLSHACSLSASWSR